MATMGRSRVSIRICGPDVDPARITARLGCAPDEGHLRSSIPERGAPRREEAWSIRSDERAPADLDAQITALLARATDDLDAWRRAGEGHRVDAFCGLFMDEWNEGLSLAPATMFALAQRGIGLALDVYGWDAKSGSAPMKATDV